MLVEHKKSNASSWNPQAAALKALLAVSLAQNSECVRLGIPRWHCVQGAAGTGVRCSKHNRERDCQLSRACLQASTHRNHEETRSQGLTRGRVRYGGFLYATAASRRPAPNPSRCKPVPSRHTRVRPMRTMQIQSSYPQVCPFAPK